MLYAREYIKAHRKIGVLTSLKHFPGHGSSTADTHFGVADVTNTWTTDELKPYRQLIDEGFADAVMSSHIVHKGLDPAAYPGTMSKRVLDSVLRKQLHFDGVVFSDDMHMHAISKQYGWDEAIKRAINAGIDVLCFSNNIPGSEQRTVDQVYQIIRTAVEKGDVPLARINQSYQRIMKLKRRLDQKNQLDQQLAQQAKTIAALQQQLAASQISVEPPAAKKKKRKRG